jgi:hypothetical protein
MCTNCAPQTLSYLIETTYNPEVGRLRFRIDANLSKPKRQFWETLIGFILARIGNGNAPERPVENFAPQKFLLIHLFEVELLVFTSAVNPSACSCRMRFTSRIVSGLPARSHLNA